MGGSSIHHLFVWQGCVVSGFLLLLGVFGDGGASLQDVPLRVGSVRLGGTALPGVAFEFCFFLAKEYNSGTESI